MSDITSLMLVPQSAQLSVKQCSEQRIEKNILTSGG